MSGDWSERGLGRLWTVRLQHAFGGTFGLGTGERVRRRAVDGLAGRGGTLNWSVRKKLPRSRLDRLLAPKQQAPKCRMRLPGRF